LHSRKTTWRQSVWTVITRNMGDRLNIRFRNGMMKDGKTPRSKTLAIYSYWGTGEGDSAVQKK
jgi:hypothetical protein